jgi:hypothetical protein
LKNIEKILKKYWRVLILINIKSIEGCFPNSNDSDGTGCYKGSINKFKSNQNHQILQKYHRYIVEHILSIFYHPIFQKVNFKTCQMYVESLNSRQTNNCLMSLHSLWTANSLPKTWLPELWNRLGNQ